MGNVGSNNSNGRRRHRSSGRRSHHQFPQPPPSPLQPPPPPDMTNRYVFAASTPYPNPPPYYQYPTGSYYPPPPLPAVPLQLPPEHNHHRIAAGGTWVGGRYPCAPVMHLPTPYVDHQKAVTIRNDVNIKKETLKIEADEENPGKFIVSFTFDATVACSITLYFFAKEEENCKLTTVKPDSIPPLTLTFPQGLGQKFKQIPGTGIDLSAYDESELSNANETSVYPLAVKAEATPSLPDDKNRYPGVTNSQITDAVFEKVKGEFKARVVKQILWVNGTRYELQEIYGIGNSVDSGGYDPNDSSKECVICLSEPCDTTVLPCRHMCLCNECAKVLRFQTNRCPICRQGVERLLEIKIKLCLEKMNGISSLQEIKTNGSSKPKESMRLDDWVLCKVNQKTCTPRNFYEDRYGQLIPEPEKLTASSMDINPNLEILKRENLLKDCPILPFIFDSHLDFYSIDTMSSAISFSDSKSSFNSPENRANMQESLEGYEDVKFKYPLANIIALRNATGL
ncbi:hypothetical protein E3N88_43628 [Mikania micrantha]|uniref:RING-type E3 ubiquitin transferase n=1 Tax=Mikania micrantha TaxID=192012 RepID=A0A5N6LEE5_9ASTR|nr:hypothetical protein E3N88_43628 [Mikania micrantha]